MEFSGKRILFVGYRGKQSHLRTAREKGMHLDLLTEKGEMCTEYAKEFERVHVLEDIFDWRQIVPALEGTSYDGVLTRFEDFTLLASAIADHLGLPGVPFEHAPKFRNKYLMREAFAAHGVPSAEYALVASCEDARAFAVSHRFPLIVKQISGIHSKYVARVSTERELCDTITFFLDALSKEEGALHGQLHHFPRGVPGPDPRRNLLVEECLEGEELTVDAFVVGGRVYATPVCKYLLPEEMGFEDHHLPIRIMPCDLAMEEHAAVSDAVTRALHALGADFCVTHVEVFFDRAKRECRLVEAASRGGGFRAEMLKHTCGADYDFGLVRAVMGLNPLIEAAPQCYAAVAEVFAPQNGVLEGVDYTCLQARDDVFSITENRKIGDAVGRASDGHSFIVKFLVTGVSYAEAEHKARQLLLAVRSSLRVRPAAQ